MARSSNQKLKLLVIRDYLLSHSDDEHPVTVAQIIAELARHDITAERKSIYDDLETLRIYGLDIIQEHGNYYIGQRLFEAPELKLLVDSIQSSKFITQKKTVSLIKKLEGLTSSHGAQLLERQVYVRSRVKSMNESVYYNVDSISDAINSDRMISFKYFEFTVSKERRFRREGALYEVSPFALIWDDENYYMLAWDSAAGKMKHYRVDKMLNISSLDRTREGKEAFSDIDMSSYSQRVFGMFTGSVQYVKMRFENSLAGAVIDRFGRDAAMFPEDPEHFTAGAEIAVSPQFFAWIFGFGTRAEIISPESVREQAAEAAEKIAKMYGK